MLSGGLDAVGQAEAPTTSGPARADVLATTIFDDSLTDTAPPAVGGHDGSGEPGTSDQDEPLADWVAVVGVAALAAAVALWLRSLTAVEPRDMDGFGLLSVVPPLFFVAVAMLTVGFLVAVVREPVRHGLVAGYVAAFAAVVHLTPVVLSRSLGNSWAWANVGVVEHVQREGSLPADTGELAASTDWPGAVAFTALLAEVSGLAPQTVAAWMPFATTLLVALGLWVLFRSLSPDRRVAWTGIWLYVVGNWVGQEHLSPVGFGLGLSIGLLAIALPLDRVRTPDAPIVANHGPSDDRPLALGATVAFVLAVALTVVASDPAASIVLALSFLVAALLAASRTAWLAAVLGVATLAWTIGPARSVLDDPRSILDTTGAPAEFASAAGAALSELAGDTQAVVIGGRFVAEVLLLLAVIGLALRWRHREPVALLAALSAVPVVVVLAGLDNESALRAYLYALPWLAFAAALLLARVAGSGRIGFGGVVRGVAVAALTGVFLVARFGHSGPHYFTADEVELATWLHREAPPNTLLVEGSTNYPGRNANIERFEHAPLSLASPEVMAAVEADPEGVIHDILVDHRAIGDGEAYVVLFRSQQFGETIAPRLPDGLLTDVEDALAASERFRAVGANTDAVVFALASEVGS